MSRARGSAAPRQRRTFQRSVAATGLLEHGLGLLRYDWNSARNRSGEQSAMRASGAAGHGRSALAPRTHRAIFDADQNTSTEKRIRVARERLRAGKHRDKHE